jgi:hypothetical protein
MASPTRPFGRVGISTYDGRLRSSCYDESRPLIAALADLFGFSYVLFKDLGLKP